MLERTFCHIPGVGETTERSLWAQGCKSWDDYLERPGDFSVGSVDRRFFDNYVAGSVARLQDRDYRFFAQTLGLRESWRAWRTFREECVYLDIETDGGQTGSSITMVGLYAGGEFRCLVQGDNLDEFPEAIAEYPMIVTFFGSGFDIPMLQKAFVDVKFDQIHLDLCPSLRRIGLRGGLKKIEKQLGISRSDETDGLSGYDAILLWRRYLGGSDDALETLIEYNREDVVNLETLAEVGVERLSKSLLSDTSLVKAD